MPSYLSKYIANWNRLDLVLLLLLFGLPIYCSTNPIMYIVVNTANLNYHHTQQEYLLINWDMEVVWKRRELSSPHSLGDVCSGNRRCPYCEELGMMYKIRPDTVYSSNT